MFESTTAAIDFISNHLFLLFQSYELILGEEHVSVVKRGQNDEVPYTVRYMGMYLVIETTSGLILMWDKKTSIFIKLSPDFKVWNQELNGNLQSRFGLGVNFVESPPRFQTGDVSSIPERHPMLVFIPLVPHEAMSSSCCCSEP